MLNRRHIAYYLTLLTFTIASHPSFAGSELSPSLNHAPGSAPAWLTEHCPACEEHIADKTGLYIINKGEEALLARAWLTQNAVNSIDVQYFIWSTDNIGILASEALLSAAERGVKVRVLVDDFLMAADDEILLALATHANISIKIYNPQSSVGVSPMRKVFNIVKGFRAVNQRMHDKTAIFDGVAGITGGRNMADEYFDFDHEYNFRDRDILLLGKAVPQMQTNFDEFWNSDLSFEVSDILAKKLARISPETLEKHRQNLHDYAQTSENFSPLVRQALANLPSRFSSLIENLVWDDAEFISDIPGKNTNQFFLDGGGETTTRLRGELRNAKHSVIIQSPYLVLPKGGVELLKELTSRGVEVKISTNSMASTDNLMAYSGYHKQRKILLAAGVKIYEYKPSPAIQSTLIERFPQLDLEKTVFAIHAKSMVIDRERFYIGTFNLDPRSANLNTEVGVLVTNARLGEQLAQSIETDMHEDNSWAISEDSTQDQNVPFGKRFKLGLFKLLPMTGVL